MSTIMKVAFGAIGVFSLESVSAQELSQERYVGALEGAAHACAEAYPQKAAVYRESLQRTLSCHMNATEFARWHKALRATPTQAQQYQQGYDSGKASLSRSEKASADQCRSLELLACDPKSPP
jgi:hypothetical protein